MKVIRHPQHSSCMVIVEELNSKNEILKAKLGISASVVAGGLQAGDELVFAMRVKVLLQ